LARLFAITLLWWPDAGATTLQAHNAYRPVHGYFGNLITPVVRTTASPPWTPLPIPNVPIWLNRSKTGLTSTALIPALHVVGYHYWGLLYYDRSTPTVVNETSRGFFYNFVTDLADAAVVAGVPYRFVQLTTPPYTRLPKARIFPFRVDDLTVNASRSFVPMRQAYIDASLAAGRRELRARWGTAALARVSLDSLDFGSIFFAFPGAASLREHQRFHAACGWSHEDELELGPSKANKRANSRFYPGQLQGIVFNGLPACRDPVGAGTATALANALVAYHKEAQPALAGPAE